PNDAASVDQNVLGPGTYFTTPTGAATNDVTMRPETGGSTGGGGGGGGGGTASADIMLHPTNATVAGNWIVTSDATAAGGASLLNPDHGAAKIAEGSAAVAAPADY